MKYYFNKVCINPENPAYAVGFSVEKDKSVDTKLDLNMRILYLKDQDTNILLCTLDSLDVSYDVYQKLNDIVNTKFPNTQVIITCSHTHYAPSLANQFPMLKIDEVYLKQVIKQFSNVIDKIDLKEFDGYAAYNYVPFNKVGSTRISAKADNNVYCGVLSIFDKDERIGNFIHYNCHPTEDEKDPKYFSSAYVGATLNKLEEIYPNEFFMFLQGSDGDVSSRFTRKERSFNQTLEFGKLLSNCVIELINKNTNKEKLILSGNSITYDFKYSIKEIPIIPDDLLNSLKDNERKELLIGLEELKKYKSYANLPKLNITNLNRVNFGSIKLFFSPFELFSDYNDLIDKNKTLLVGYSNGAIAYLLPINNNKISYEYFLETINDDDKKLVVEAINNL